MFSPEMSIREISVSPDSPDVCWVWFLVAMELTKRVLSRIALRKFCSFGVDKDWYKRDEWKSLLNGFFVFIGSDIVDVVIEPKFTNFSCEVRLAWTGRGAAVRLGWGLGGLWVAICGRGKGCAGATAGCVFATGCGASGCCGAAGGGAAGTELVCVPCTG